MPAIQQSVEQLKTLFALRQCWMIEPLAASMGCAVVSVRRLLRQAGYLRSYTHNGKWYTLDSIPAFDRHGIWVHEEIAFSRHGDLIKTIAHLLDKSPRGLSARELSEILHHPCQAVLTHLHKAERVARVRGAQAFVYLSSDASTRQRQRKALPAVERAQRPPLTAEVAVFVLVDYIHHPSWSWRELVRGLKKNRGIVVSPEAIESFFAQHGLKKRPASGS
ncbi:MAG: hypothetical protein GY926_01725 [bacterium]|nr:hypothetical protein [bacterium]